MYMLYGITTLQTYIYYSWAFRDPLVVKLLSYSLWILDTLHMGFVSHAMYYWLIGSYSNIASLGSGIWTLSASVGINVAIAFLVQSYFAYKIFCLCKPRWRWVVTSFVGVLILVNTGFGTQTTAVIAMRWDLVNFSSGTRQAIVSYIVAAIACNGAIMVCLTILLYNKKTSFRRTNVMIHTLIIYAVERFFLITAVLFAQLVGTLVDPDALWPLSINFLIGQLEANSLLATLNARQRILATSPAGNKMSGINSIRVDGLPTWNGQDPAVIDVHARFAVSTNEAVEGSRDLDSTADAPRDFVELRNVRVSGEKSDKDGSI